MTLEQIQIQTKHYADARQKLSDEATCLNEELEAVKRKRLARIKLAVASAADRRAALKGAIELSPELFVKPRTLVVHGIKIGFQKGKGGLEFDDAAAVVARIKKIYEPASAKTFIHVEESPNKIALADLPAAELKRLGVEIIASGDQVVIKPTDSDVDKIVTALLKDAESEAA